MKVLDKAVSTCLCLSMLAAMYPFSIAAENSSPQTFHKEKVFIVNTGHGAFNMINQQTRVADSNAISITAIEDVAGLYQSLDETLYLQCTESSFLQVEKVKIPVDDQQQTEKLISAYDLDEVLAEDLRQLCYTANADDTAPPEVILYTSSELGTNRSTVQKPARYYTYNGYNLKDDVLYTKYVTPFSYKSFSGQSTISKLKDITDVALYAVGSGTSKFLSKVSLIGGGVSLTYGLLQNWVTQYGASRLNAKAGDYSQFSIDYTSNTKYTCVENGQGNYPTCAKTGDVLINRLGVHAYINDCARDDWYKINAYAYTPNYTNPAPKAIASPSGPWIETIEYRMSGGYVFCPNDV